MLNARNKKLLQNLLSAAEAGRVSHAYLFSGENRTESLEMAEQFAAALTKSAADRIYPEHEKPQLISVDDVRREINATVSMVPYEGPKKVYIIKDAEKMNVQAQNALLKTLEEPPEYVVMILIAGSSSEFLQTILSRCVKITISAYGTEDGEEVDELREIEELNRGLLHDALQMNIVRIRAYDQAIDKMKVYADYALEDLRGWFRDVLIYKEYPSVEVLNHKNDLRAVSDLSKKLSAERINDILTEIDHAKYRAWASVNTELSFEILLLKIQEACKEAK